MWTSGVHLQEPWHGVIDIPFAHRMRRTVIDCNALLWRNALKTSLQEGNEVDWENIEYTADGVFCELLAFSHGMTFQLGG